MLTTIWRDGRGGFGVGRLDADGRRFCEPDDSGVFDRIVCGPAHSRQGNASAQRDNLARASVADIRYTRHRAIAGSAFLRRYGRHSAVRLMELLPRLTPADAALFSDAQRQNFHRALADTNTDLVTIVLKALEKIGDGRAVPYVARLAAGKGRARVDPQVLYAAQRCLPILQARALYDTANHTLLRSASPPPANGEQLLRSAHDTVIPGAEECSDPLMSSKARCREQKPHCNQFVCHRWRRLGSWLVRANPRRQDQRLLHSLLFLYQLSFRRNASRI